MNHLRSRMLLKCAASRRIALHRIASQSNGERNWPTSGLECRYHLRYCQISTVFASATSANVSPARVQGTRGERRRGTATAHVLRVLHEDCPTREPRNVGNMPSLSVQVGGDLGMDEERKIVPRHPSSISCICGVTRPVNTELTCSPPFQYYQSVPQQAAQPQKGAIPSSCNTPQTCPWGSAQAGCTALHSGMNHALSAIMQPGAQSQGGEVLRNKNGARGGFGQ